MLSEKEVVIEYIDYNVLLSIMDYFIDYFKDKKVHNKSTAIVQSYSDPNIEYTSPSISVEILHRKNRSLGFNNFIGETNGVDTVVEFDGINFEYRVQINVYSNTRGGNHKWSSLLDDSLAKGDSGLPLNTYNDDGSVKQAGIGKISYDYSSDVTNNNQIPNINTYDFHTLYEVKMNAIQLYKATYEYIKIDIEGSLKENN